MSFNNAQNQAIAHKDGPCMVLAGPGSGKTTVIANRIHQVVLQKSWKSLVKKNLLCVSVQQSNCLQNKR